MSSSFILLNPFHLGKFTTLMLLLLSSIWLLGALLVFHSVFVGRMHQNIVQDEDTIEYHFSYSESHLQQEISSFKLSLMDTLIFCGWLFGSTFFSYLSDQFGRRKIFIISASGLFLSLIWQFFAFNFDWFLAGRFFMGFCIGGNGVLVYVWGSEFMMQDLILFQLEPMIQQPQESIEENELYINTSEQSEMTSFHLKQRKPPKQSTGGACFQLFWSLGGMLLSLLVFMVPNWQRLHFILMLFAILLSFVIIFLVPESPIWLQNKGMQKESKLIEEKMLHWEQYEPLVQTSTPLTSPTLSSASISAKKSTFLDLFKRDLLLVTLCLCFLWFTCAFTYYALSLNASIFMPSSSLFITFCLLNLISIPGQLIALPIGRLHDAKVEQGKNINKMALVLSLLFTSCLFCLLFILYEFKIKPTILLTILILMGQFMVNLAFTLCYSVTSNSFPTSIRNSGVGLGVMIGRIGAMLCPFLKNFTSDGTLHPFAFLGLSLVCLLTTLLVYKFVPGFYLEKEKHPEELLENGL